MRRGPAKGEDLSKVTRSGTPKEDTALGAFSPSSYDLCFGGVGVAAGSYVAVLLYDDVVLRPTIRIQ